MRTNDLICGLFLLILVIMWARFYYKFVSSKVKLIRKHKSMKKYLYEKACLIKKITLEKLKVLFQNLKLILKKIDIYCNTRLIENLKDNLNKNKFFRRICLLISIFIGLCLMKQISLFRYICNLNISLYVQMIIFTIILALTLYKVVYELIIDKINNNNGRGKSYANFLNFIAGIEIFILVAMIFILIFFILFMLSLTDDYKIDLIISITIFIVGTLFILKMWKFFSINKKYVSNIIFTIVVYAFFSVFISIPYGCIHLINNVTKEEGTRIASNVFVFMRYSVEDGLYSLYNYPQFNNYRDGIASDLDDIQAKLKNKRQFKQQIYILEQIQDKSEYMNKMQYEELKFKLDSIKNKSVGTIVRTLNKIKPEGLIENKFQKYMFLFSYLQYFGGLVFEWTIMGYIAAIVIEYIEDKNDKENSNNNSKIKESKK